MAGYEIFSIPQRDVLPEEAAETMKNILKKDTCLIVFLLLEYISH